MSRPTALAMAKRILDRLEREYVPPYGVGEAQMIANMLRSWTDPAPPKRKAGR